MSDRKILVADYNVKELQQLKKVFSDEGFYVIAVQDGKQALEKFFETLPDVVLVSAMLSKVNGFDVCKQIKESEAGRNTPVILATSVYKGQKYRVKAIHENKASEFIEKPVPNEVLVEAVRKVLGVAPPKLETAKDPAPVNTPAPTQPPAPATAAALSPEPTAATPQTLDYGRTMVIASVADFSQTVASPAGGTSQVDVTVAVQPSSVGMDVDKLLKREIASSLLAQEKPKKEESDSDASLDRLLSDTLSGLGLDFGGKAKPPAQTARAGPAPEAPPPGPLQAFDKLQQAKEIKTGTTPPHAAAAVERILASFDSDLERKLSDTLSGVGLSDTNIDRVLDSPNAPDRTVVEIPPEPEPDEEGTRFGEYILVEKIGHGGMAELFKAKKRGHGGFQKIVAIKKILPHLSDNQELVTMFIDEAKIAAHLNHQNIANIHDFGKAENSYFIAMEYVDGFDLKRVLSRAKDSAVRVPHKLAAFIAQQIASGLDFAHHKKDLDNHDLNIVHRDVSPQNILISREGEVKLVDFGISKAESKIHHTVKGALKGKLLYMSPEQAWGKSVDKRSDLYSLGIVLCEMVSGKVLFEDSSEFDVLEKVRSGKIPLLDSVQASLPPKLKTLVDRALQIDPANRYQDAGEMISDLYEYIHGSGAVPTPKDLTRFLARLFPQQLGLRESEVQNLKFDEFVEKSDAVAAQQPQPKKLGSDTVLLDQADLADLQVLPAMPLPAPKAADVKAPAKPPDPKAAPPPPPTIYEDEEIIVEPQPDTRQPAPAPLLPPAEAKVSGKPTEVAKAEKRAVPAKTFDKKKQSEPQKAAPPNKPPEPKKAEAKRDPAAKSADAKPAVAKPAEKAQTKLLKEPAKAQPPTAQDPKRKKPFPVVWAVAAAVVAVVLAIVLFLVIGGKKAETGAGGTSGGAAPTVGAPVSGTVQPAPSGADVGGPAKERTPEAASKEPVKERPEPAKPEPAKTETKGVAAEPPKPDKQEKPAQQTAAETKTETAPDAEPAPAPVQQTKPVEEPKPEPPKPKPAEVKPSPAPQPGGDFQMSLPTQQEQLKTGDTVALTPDVIPPRLVKEVKPRYPEAAKRQFRSAVTITCRLLVSHTGEVEKVIIQSANPPNAKTYFGPEAEGALRQWKFTPAEKNGVKVRVWKSFVLSFSN